MGLKPLNEKHLFNPFTKVNGNEKHQTFFYQLFLLPAFIAATFIAVSFIAVSFS